MAMIARLVWVSALLGAVSPLGHIESRASTKPVHLSCTGTIMATIRAVEEDYTVAITIDLEAKTVTVGSYGSAPIFGNRSGDTMFFMAAKKSRYGVSTGSINRLTGVATVHVITLTDGVLRFHGICKPAQKLLLRSLPDGQTD
jgi:hypothetical protein